MATKTATNINFYYANIALITLFLRTRPPNKLFPTSLVRACVWPALQLCSSRLLALINHWKIGFSYVQHSVSSCLPSPRAQFMQFPIPTVALWRQKSIVAPSSCASYLRRRQSFDKHKHKLNQYPWIGQ